MSQRVTRYRFPAKYKSPDSRCMCPNKMGCSQVPRTRKFASASNSAPGHSIRASGEDEASMSNCKLRKKGESVDGPEIPSLEETRAPALSSPCVHKTRCTATFPETTPESVVPVSRKFPPSNQLMPSG